MLQSMVRHHLEEIYFETHWDYVPRLLFVQHQFLHCGTSYCDTMYIDISARMLYLKKSIDSTVSNIWMGEEKNNNNRDLMCENQKEEEDDLITKSLFLIVLTDSSYRYIHRLLWRCLLHCWGEMNDDAFQNQVASFEEAIHDDRTEMDKVEEPSDNDDDVDDGMVVEHDDEDDENIVVVKVMVLPKAQHLY